MKFARYLAENLTPEWKRAYIDYRALKKKIKIIQARLGQTREQAEGEDGGDSSDNDADTGPSAPPKNASPGTLRNARSSRGRGSQANTPALRGSQSQRTTPNVDYGATQRSPRPLRDASLNPPPLDIGEASLSQSPTRPTETRTRSARGPVTFGGEDHAEHPNVESPEAESPHDSNEEAPMHSEDSNEPLRPNGTDAASPSAKGTPKVAKSPRFSLNIRSRAGPAVDHSPKTPSTRAGTNRSIRSLTLPSPRLPPRVARSFEDLYEELEDDEKDFFDLLDHELDKVESFYIARRDEAVRRAHDLRQQLRELAEHRKLYHELYPEGLPEWEARVERVIPGVTPHSAHAFDAALQKLHLRKPHRAEPGGARPKEAGAGAGAGTGNAPQNGPTKSREREALRAAMLADKDHHTYSPERYQKYKGELRKAVLEYYRTLELIKNYRIMNLTGFRKALKKFEKVTNIHCMEMYTDERISKESFARGETIDKLIKETEDLYSEHFEHGDSKKAREKLRRQDRVSHSHYVSMFRSGSYIGIGLFAAVSALVQAQKPETLEAIPGRDGLLQIYGGIFIPLIFAVIFELNLDAWVNARINYEFVMELSRPSLDFRSYLEIPAFLFMTFGICMYFSFYQIGADNVAPTTWPAAWLVFFVVFVLNPIPILRRRSRFWFLRVLFRVFTPGISRVEFTAFFIADELNSLVYSIQTIMFLSCVYGKQWPSDVYGACPTAASWPYILVSILPGFIRFIQCLKRYHDSRLDIHLINAGKYASTMLQYTFFVLWRMRGSSYSDGIFIAWVIVGVIYSTYSCAWDFIVDWSLLRPGTRLLRHDLAYGNTYVYYLAMFTNLVVRFFWVFYIPQKGSHIRLRSFFFAIAEMLRRWQWNFFRVETEHLGNADAYRVTREIPLPYRRADVDLEEEDLHDWGMGRKDKSLLVTSLSALSRVLSGSSDGKRPSTPDGTPKGGPLQREYEARRPGDVASPSFRARPTVSLQEEEQAGM